MFYFYYILENMSFFWRIRNIFSSDYPKDFIKSKINEKAMGEYKDKQTFQKEIEDSLDKDLINKYQGYYEGILEEAWTKIDIKNKRNNKTSIKVKLSKYYSKEVDNIEEDLRAQIEKEFSEDEKKLLTDKDINDEITYIMDNFKLKKEQKKKEKEKNDIISKLYNLYQENFSTKTDLEERINSLFLGKKASYLEDTKIIEIKNNLIKNYTDIEDKKEEQRKSQLKNNIMIKLWPFFEDRGSYKNEGELKNKIKFQLTPEEIKLLDDNEITKQINNIYNHILKNVILEQ